MNIVDIPFQLISVERPCCVPFLNMFLERGGEEPFELDSAASIQRACEEGYISYVDVEKGLFQIEEGIVLLGFHYFDIPMLDGERPFFLSWVPIVDRTQQKTNFYRVGMVESCPPVISCYSMTLSKEEGVFETMATVGEMLELAKEGFIRVEKDLSIESGYRFFLQKKAMYGVLHFGEYLCFTISPPIDKKIALERLE
ncbi:hypothetical protein [Listeria booriae]|uniref:hypothetical protein n=1 Tax=Listeria booriae TaxID=1552123 RepID=UPI001629A0B9|nr:hypothetical protein [Listeria booriae]MBC2193671.1 hypothetical protein [Listeria booriae]